MQAIFVTVDPDRDTSGHLKTYLSSFHPPLVGLTGASDDIRRLPDAYNTYYRRAETPDGYTVDHSAYVYLMDRDGAYLGSFPPNTNAERIVTILRPHLRPTR